MSATIPYNVIDDCGGYTNSTVQANYLFIDAIYKSSMTFAVSAHSKILTGQYFIGEKRFDFTSGGQTGNFVASHQIAKWNSLLL
jgi:hypothetical protein